MPQFLLSSIILFIVWLIFWFVSKDTRKEQIIMSIVGLVMAPPLLLIAATDYHKIVANQALPIGIEDLLFSFCLFGIASIIYHILLGKHVHKFKGDRLRFKNPVIHWISHLILVLGAWACISLGAITIFQLPSMQSIMLGGLMIGIYIIADRHDLLMDALLSGLMTAILLFLVEHIFFVRLFPDVAANFWQWNTLSKFAVGGIPFEEIVWAGVVGFTIGPMYEWLRRYRIT